VYCNKWGIEGKELEPARGSVTLGASKYCQGPVRRKRAANHHTMLQIVVRTGKLEESLEGQL